MIFQSRKLQMWFKKDRYKNMQHQMKKRRNGDGGCFGLENKITGWIWRQLSHIRKLSVMEVRIVTVPHPPKKELQDAWRKSITIRFFFFFLGYYGDGLNAIVVFAVCFMPESGQPNYRYLMDNLFKWVVLDECMNLPYSKSDLWSLRFLPCQRQNACKWWRWKQTAVEGHCGLFLRGHWLARVLG